MTHQNYTMLCGVLVFNTDRLKTIEVDNHKISPYIEFEVITDSAEFGGHIPCIAYGTEAIHVLAFGLAAGKTLEGTVQGWVRSIASKSVVIVAREVAFMVDKDTRKFAAQNIDLIKDGKRPVKRDVEGVKSLCRGESFVSALD